MRLRLRLRLRLCLITLASVLQAASPGFRASQELHASSRFAISSVVSHGQFLLSASPSATTHRSRNQKQ